MIGVVGCGRMGSRLAARWVAAGYDVCVSEPIRRSPRLVASTGQRAPLDRVLQCPIVVLAIPASECEEVLEARPLSGTLIFDCTNPDPWAGDQPSSVACINRAAPGARLVKAINTVGAALLDGPISPEALVAGLYCGDDVEAKQIVREMILALNLVPVDVGPLGVAVELEAIAGAMQRLLTTFREPASLIGIAAFSLIQ